jgi:hypothetical protein
MFKVKTFIILGSIVIVIVIVAKLYKSKRNNFAFNGDSPTEEKCIEMCEKNCNIVCLKNPGATISHEIFNTCVSVCEGGVASCKNKCKGCNTCS